MSLEIRADHFVQFLRLTLNVSMILQKTMTKLVDELKVDTTTNDVSPPELFACCDKRKFFSLMLKTSIKSHYSGVFRWIHALVFLLLLLSWLRNEHFGEAYGRGAQNALHYRKS